MPDENQKFAVIAEITDYQKPLYLYNLTFSRLIDDVVFPYQSDQPFFIDGVPTKAQNLKKIKIIRQNQSFDDLFNELHHFLRAGSSSARQITAADYPIRLEALFREAGEDVTSQVIKAFNAKIRPSLKDYMPKREELINGALQIFIEAMKILGKRT